VPLGELSQIMLKDLLWKIIEFEEKLDVMRMFLCSNELFDPYSAFCRIDRNQDGFVTPMELVSFFRDNGMMSVTEADCYYVLKFFDCDQDGKLHYTDFLQIMLPCTNNKYRAEAT